MPIARFEMPDGRIARFEVPEGTTPEQAQSMISQHIQGQSAAPDKPAAEQDGGGFVDTAIDTAAGLGKGVGDVALGAQHYLGKFANTIGADTVGDWLVNDAAQGRQKLAGELAPYKARSPIAAPVGEITGNVIATAPVGGLLAKGARAVPALSRVAPNLAPALESGGFRLAQKATTLPGKVANAVTRAGAGAAVGGASAGLVNPDDVGVGAVLGGVLPGATRVAGMLGNAINTAGKSASRKLMQSAVKPTLEQLRKGDAQVAIDTLIKYGINPTKSGVEKLRVMVDDVNSQIAAKIAASNATVNKTDVLDYLKDPAKRFANQVSPTSDLKAIAGVADDFLHHPGFPGSSIPVQAAQALKQGTYKSLAGKYGEVGSAATEAQKALARGLKEKIGDAIPDVIPLNAEESKLLKTLKVAERRSLMDLNKNPVGLSALASNPSMFALFMADRSAAFKGIAARMVNRASGVPSAVSPYVDTLLANPLARNAGLLSISGNP